VVAGVAMLAGGEPQTAIRLGVSMTALQAAIGTLNDLVDAPSDAGHKPGKPIPAGLVPVPLARAVVVAGVAIGLLLAWPSGPALVGLALLVLAIGFGYDLVAKGTAWSWLPFAVGIPILPLYGWLGATGSVASFFVALLPVAALAGAGLAIANTRADMDRDRDAGTSSVALALGDRWSWIVGAGVLVLAFVLAAGWLVSAGQGSAASVVVVAAGGIVVLLGLILGRTAGAARRERGWQVQAVGVAVVAIGWVAGVVGATG
jgi:4-hydroxybenzoate polyprenyltransferase